MSYAHCQNEKTEFKQSWCTMKKYEFSENTIKIMNCGIYITNRRDSVMEYKIILIT